MRVPVLALSWSLGAVLALQSPVHAQAADPPLPVSMDRIRAGLNQPPTRLQIPPPSADLPTFRIEVREPLFTLEPVDEEPSDPTMGLPSMGELLMNGIEHIRSAVVDYKRGRAERRARKEVDGALAAFCAVRECTAPDPDK